MNLTDEEVASLLNSSSQPPAQPGGSFSDEDVAAMLNESVGKMGSVKSPLGATDLGRGIVEGYDIASYATKSGHEAAVKSIYDKINKVGLPNFMAAFRGSTPVTEAMINASAQKYGVDPVMMAAIMQADSSMGTRGKAVRTFNPGNVGNMDDGSTRNFGSWESGVDAVAKNLSKRKIVTAGVNEGSPKMPLNESTGKRIARVASSYVLRPALEMGGAIGGGMLAAPVNVVAPGVAEALGVGGGYAAGRMAADLFDEVTGLKQEKPPWEKVKEAALWDIPVMAALGPAGARLVESTMSLGQLAKPGVKAAIDSLDRAVVPEGRQAVVAAGKALSERTGVDLLPDQLSQSRSIAYLRQQLQKNMASSDVAAEKLGRQQEQLQNLTKTIQFRNLGGKSDWGSAGQAVQDSAWTRLSAFQKKASRIYDSVPVAPETPVPTTSLSSVASEHLDELGKLSSPSVRRILKITQESEIPASVETRASSILDASGRPIMAEVEVPAKPTYTWETLRADQSELGKLEAKTTDWNTKRILRDLKYAINEDISEFAHTVGDPAIKRQIDLANKYYRHGDSVFGPPPPDALPGVATWKDRQILNLMKNTSPEKIGKKFFSAQPNASDIQRLKAVAGEKSYNEMLQSWFEDLTTKGADFTFSPQRFQTSYENYLRSGNLDAMLTKAQRAGMDDLYELSRRINRMERATGNPSGSGQHILNDLGKWYHHPFVSSMQLIGMNRLAKMYFNDPKWQATFARGLRESLKQEAKGLAPGPKTLALTRQIVRSALIQEEDMRTRRLPPP